ncbi:MAG: hypothetical protein J0L97_09090, partial [Alphaproteobacteria bacterium]|nr:hypothetical protein [Alphaproteobacteria bacterium]
CKNRDELMKDVATVAVLGGIRQDTTDLRLVATLLRSMSVREDGMYFYVRKSALTEGEALEVYHNLKTYLPDAQFSAHPNVCGYQLSDADILFVVENNALSSIGALHEWAESIIRTGSVAPKDEVRWIAPGEPDDFTQINPHFDHTRYGAHLEEDPFGGTAGYRVPDSLRQR